MSVIVKDVGGKSFPPHPADQYAATCIDVWDVGLVETKFGKKHRVALRYFCGEWHEIDGERHPAFLDAYFNATLNEKATLRQFLEAWRGKVFTKDELNGFDLEDLVGAPAFVQVVHNPTPDRVYANIKVIMRLPKGMEAPGTPNGYVRVKDRPTEGEESPDEPSYTVAEDDDSGLPF